ncbi:hypothetical protein [Pseudomonas juntendi]|uniref:Mobilization protein n=1 Tax=Pseudomonas juntendi TaxID=2666183 RepID=A0A7W2PUN3_9PSED|nr:hypothetical protein [Pseudomonas juntendi]MBA6061444.1 hypothetical protein [Pseudomonas juntendi]MBA6127560.1 hypothetical protein [Pseudomonas juntendi]
MNNYVSFNAKYYKNSQSEGEIGHVQRVFAENKNSIKELQKNNFDCGYSIIDKYKDIYAQAEQHKGKKLQKNANTFIDGVLAFSRDQFELLMENPQYKRVISNHIDDFMQQVKAQTGLEPVGWAFHADEGHKDPETGDLKINYHAQLIFFNHDFKTGKAPLRELKQRGSESAWSKLQDLAGQVFQPLGFVRGISKDMTHQRHTEKDDFIAQKQAEIERLQAELENEKNHQNRALQNNMELLEAAATATDEILKDVNGAIDIINRMESKRESEKELKEQILKNIKGGVEIYNKTPALQAAAKAFSGQFPKFTEGLKKTYQKLLEFFNIDTSGDPEYMLKNAQENIAKVEQQNAEVKRRLLKLK